MGYNKKVLSKATSELGKAKKPSTPRDKVVDSKGYWNPDNQDKSVVRVPGNSITMRPNPETGEPIPFPIYGIPNVGMPQMMYPGNDYSFSGADYVDEYLVAKKGGSLPSLPKKANSKKYSRSLTATNKLFAQNPLTKKSKSKKNKIFDPNAKYYQDGGESVCLDDGRCFETDEEQRLLDLEADLRRKAVDTAGAAFELTGDAGDARKAFKKLGMKKSLGERLPGVENPYTCMYYAGMPYCINEGVDPKYFESNDKFIKAQAQGKIPFTQIAETYDPNFEQNLNIPTGSIVSLEKPTGMKHAMLSFKHPETGESSYFQSTGEESDWDIRNQVFYRPSENHPARIYQYTPFATEREKLAEQARTNPTYYNTKLQTRPAQPLELDLTPEEIIEYQKGGYTIEYLDDPSIPQLTKAQEGIVTEPELTYEAPETFAYANKEAEKKHKLLMDKARALMTTAQGRKLWYNELKPKDFTVKELSRFVKGVGDYNKEAQAYQKAKRRMEEDKISTDTFAQLYNQRGWAKFDPNTMREGYEGQFQDAEEEANRRKEKNMAVTDAFLELTGATALKNIASDPVGTLKGVGKTVLDLTASANPSSFVNFTQPNVNPLTGEQYWSGLNETLDVVGVAPFFGAAGRLAKAPVSSGLKGLAETLPQYKNVYRVEPTSFTKTSDLSGRWMGDLQDMPFYVRNLKDPNAGVRIMRQKLPVKKWESISGHNMPEQAKMYSAGTGEYKTVMDAAKAGELSPGAAKRLQAGVPIPSDLAELSSNPNLISLNEGIVSEELANKLRTLNKNRLFSGKEKVEFPTGDLGKEEAFNYLYNIRENIEKPILGIPRSYFPFDDGGTINDEDSIFIDIDNEDDIQRYIDQGYIVEFDEGGFVPSNTIKFATPTPKKLPNKPIEKKEDTPASTTGFMNAELKFAKPVTQRKVSQAPAEEPYVPPIGQFKYSGTPVSKAPAQPIPGGFGSMISNTGKPGVINQALLKEQEAKASKLNKAAGKMKEIEMPSIWERVMLNQSQAFSQGPDVYKAGEDLNNIIQQGQNYFSRQSSKTSNKKEPIVKPINANKEAKIKNPIVTGDPIYLNDRRYYTQEVVDLNNVKLGYRNRNEYKDINTEAGNVTAFNPFTPKRNLNLSKIGKSETFIGIDKNGKFKSGSIDQFNSDDLISKTFSNTIVDFVYNSDGTVKLEKRNKDNPNNPVPLVKVIENGKEKIGSINFLTKPNVANPYDQFGEIQGGRIILKSGGKTILVSGSVNDVVTQFKKLKEQTGKPVEFITLDNGSYNLGIRTKDKKITAKDLKEYDNLNNSGGNFLYLLSSPTPKQFTPPNNTGRRM